MNETSSYNVKAADWRKQLRINDTRTKIVIALFILIYVVVGLIIDMYLHSTPIPTEYGYTYLPLSTIFMSLITLKTIPYATMILGTIAIISVFVTFAWHDKLILLGTDYHEISADNAKDLSEKQLYNVVEEMKTAAGLTYMPRVFIIEADYMNAFASGYSEKSALIAITRGLLQKLNRSELQAVIAHELSHIRHHDIKLTLMASVLCNLMLMAIDVMFYGVIFGRRDRDNRLAAIIFVLRFLLPLLTVLLLLYLSRTREYMADAGAVELTRDNTPLADALLKINDDNQEHARLYAKEYTQTPHEDVRRAAYIFDPVQAGLEPVKSIATLFSTHPPIDERLKALGISQKETR